ncbi:MAG: NTP transferase domain-containing protein [Micrococcales bacterium]|nr:NTP transferase domain-containing protein [Micrococcales bacterium]
MTTREGRGAARGTKHRTRPACAASHLEGGLAWAAVVLTGGRARRLGGMAKADIVVGGRTLLTSTYAACRDLGAQVVVVVGPEPDEPPGLGPDGGPRLVWTREDPPFAGPARAVAAGVAALAQYTPAPGAAVAVLACDMPEVGRALPVLARAVVADGGPAPGRTRPTAPWWCVLATSSGPGGAQVQWLLGIHRWEALRDACAALSPGGSGESVRELLAPLRARRIPVPDAAAADIDTWTDLHARLGPERAARRPEPRPEGRTYRADSL